MHCKLIDFGNFYAFSVWDWDDLLFLYTGSEERIKRKALELGYNLTNRFKEVNVC
jgi:hypothetical protein